MWLRLPVICSLLKWKNIAEKSQNVEKNPSDKWDQLVGDFSGWFYGCFVMGSARKIPKKNPAMNLHG